MEHVSPTESPARVLTDSRDSLPKITLWPTHDPLDGYIGESISGPSGTASSILSKYFERPVHLVFKGPQPRPIDPTFSFPNLVATAKYQDMYPLLVLSEESIVPIEEELRGHVGTQGIDERWKVDSVFIERCVDPVSPGTWGLLVLTSVYNWVIRFRPNIVFKGAGPFAEDDWEEIRIGSESSPSLTLVSKCTRCLVSGYDKRVPFPMSLTVSASPSCQMSAQTQERGTRRSPSKY